MAVEESFGRRYFFKQPSNGVLCLTRMHAVQGRLPSLKRVRHGCHGILSRSANCDLSNRCNGDATGLALGRRRGGVRPDHRLRRRGNCDLLRGRFGAPAAAYSVSVPPRLPRLRSGPIEVVGRSRIASNLKAKLFRFPSKHGGSGDGSDEDESEIPCLACKVHRGLPFASPEKGQCLSSAPRFADVLSGDAVAWRGWTAADATGRSVHRNRSR